MNSHTSAAVKGGLLALLQLSQSSKEVMNCVLLQIVQKDLLLAYSSSSSNGNGAVIMLLNSDIQHTPAVIPG